MYTRQSFQLSVYPHIPAYSTRASECLLVPTAVWLCCSGHHTHNLFCCIAHEILPEDIGIVSSKGLDTSRQPFMVAFFQSSGRHTTHSRMTRDTQWRNKKRADTTPADTTYYPHLFTGRTSITFPQYEELVGLHWVSYCLSVSDSSAHWSSRSCQIQTLFVSFRDLEWHVSRHIL